MATPIYLSKPTPAPLVCDFGWYYGSLGSPQRLQEVNFTVGTQSYPPGVTTLAGTTVTLPTASNIVVASTASLESSGTVQFYAGTLPTQRTTTPYTVVDSTHINCTGGSGTFAAGTPIYDPRFYVDILPLRQVVIFDAIDHNNIGLPVTSPAPGTQIVSYRWDLDNGQIAYGPYVVTTYNYNIPTGSLSVKLSVQDTLGRRGSCAHTVDLASLFEVEGVALKEVQSAVHYR